MSEYTYTTQTFPMLDTGIGIEMGFESDAAFLTHQREEEAKLDPEVQAALKDYRREMQRALCREMLGIPTQQDAVAKPKAPES